MARTLKANAEGLYERFRGFVDLCVKNTFDGLDEFGRMDEGQLAMMKECNVLMKESQDYFVMEATAMDEMGDVLDELQTDMKEVNRKLNMLLEMQAKKES